MKNPILTFSSGPTNSMRGAVFLSGRTDALVIDIGGTTTDIGMVCNGFPREASSQVKVCACSNLYIVHVWPHVLWIVTVYSDDIEISLVFR